MTHRPAHFLEAEVRRACRAAPDRTVEIHLPDGTVIKMIPGEDKPEVVKKREVRL